MSDQVRKHEIGSAQTFVPLTSPDSISGILSWFRSENDNVLDASDGTVTDGEEVKTWIDTVGGNDIVGIPTRRATWDEGAGAGGYPGLTFNGLAHTMAQAAATAIADPVHIFLVYKPVTWTYVNYIFANNNGSGETALMNFPNDANKNVTMKATGGAANGITCGNGEVVDGTHSLVECLFNTTNGYIRVDDNSSVAAGASVGVADFTGIRLAATADESGVYDEIVVTELIIYSSVVSGDDLTNLRAYFTGRYGIAT